MDIPPRSIIREEAFDDELRVLLPDEEEADEYTAAAEDLLSREPEMGVPTEVGVWALPMQPVENEAVWLLYTFDESAVIFLGLRRI